VPDGYHRAVSGSGFSRAGPASAGLSARLYGYRTLLHGLRAAPPDAPFVTMWQPGRTPACETLTFGQFLSRAGSYAGSYRSQGVRARDTVVLVMPQSPALMAAFAGALLVGAVPTILAYPTFKIDPEKYRHGLAGVTRNLDARLVVVDRAFPADLLGLVARAGDTRVFSDQDAEAGAGPDDSAWAEPAPDDVAFIQHSAGTTGLQKGVALPHRSVLHQLGELARALGLSESDRIVSWLPLYHDMGFIACFILPLVAHLHTVMQSPTDWVLQPGSMLKLASDYRCTVCWLPNFAFQFMARRVPQADRRGLDLSSLRSMINCSEPVRLQSMQEFLEAFAPAGLAPAALQTSYAMAEATFAVTQSTIDGHSRPPTIWVDRDVLQAERRVELVPPDHPRALPFVSSGRCLAGTAVRITADGVDLPEGRLGDILVRSASLFQGYYNRPDLTARALHDAWYRTGDVGFRLDGEVFVVGRRDDTIIVGGRNLYPQDIEEIASGHPAVHDGRAVAFGLDNPDLGTQDLVVLAEANSDEDLGRRAHVEGEIRRAILGEIGVAPRVVHLVPPKWMVKSSAGKVARSTNRERFLREPPPGTA
jgi:fatty-acyl-CoA synthase